MEMLEKNNVEFNQEYLFESLRAHWLHLARKPGSPLLAAELASIKHKILIWGSKIS